MKAHLLHESQDLDVGGDLPPNHEDLIQDLELTTLLNAMALGDKFLFSISSQVLLTGLTEPSAILYRQRVLADCMAHPQVIRQIYAVAVAALEDKRKLWGISSRHPSSILSTAVSQLEVLIVRLRELRQIADQHAGDFSSEGMCKLFDSLQRDLDDGYFETLRGHLRQLRFRDGELMSAELGGDNSGINYVLRSGNAKRGWKELIGFEPRSSYSFSIPPRDEAGAQALADLVNRGINQVANAAAQSADHVNSYFTLLRAELGFYVSCLNLSDQLAARNQPVALPVPSAWEARELYCDELCDASLALRTERVVGNIVDADRKQLVIITGANSGGKSTFLRSIGQAQLMMQCGMFVAAKAFRASIRHGLFTHFIREEDPDMVSGRLDEELGRMSSIADQISVRSMMLFNESFAATNEREGSEIGRQIIHALLEADITIFFVTHQFDLADSFYRRKADWALFLRAERQSDGSRNFRLAAAEPLPTSFGEDLYDRIGGWMTADGQPAEADSATAAAEPPVLSLPATREGRQRSNTV